MIMNSISNVAEDAAKLTTHLTAQPAPWSDVAGSYDLDFGQAIPYQNPSRLRPRGLWGDITNVGKDVLNAAEGNADLSKSVTFPMGVGQEGQKSNIYTDDKGRLTLDCTNCFVSGNFEVAGHLSVQSFDLQDLTLTASPNGFQAELELEATITSSENPDSLQYTKELFSFPVPDAGIEVEGIFKLGATLSYDVGVSSSFAGSATVDFGLKAGIPDSAKLLIDVQNPDQSSANGFGVADVTPIFDISKESASITLAAFSQPKLAFGIELIEAGNFDVAITVKLPEISVSLTAEYDEAGACSQTAGSSQTGIKLDSNVDVELDLQIDASLGDDEDTVKPSWSKKLWGISELLGSMCFPMDIPGLNGTANTTTIPSISSGSRSSAETSTGGSKSVIGSSRSIGFSGVSSSLLATRSNSMISSFAREIGVMPSVSSFDVTPTASPFTATVTHRSSALDSLSRSSGASLPSAHTISTATSFPSPLATPSISGPSEAANGDKKAAVVHSLTSSSIRQTPYSTIPETTTSKHSAEQVPAISTSKPASTSSSTRASRTAEVTSSAESGGGGCRMVKRFGKRMLVC